ncbi:homoserine kinase [Sphingobacteriales bacterium CHB3]|nr:homoserine kinase [Sphingobacteriales bacterium CHB3]
MNKKNLKSVTVFAPATIGNAGSGFDVIGIAIDKPGDIVVASRSKQPGLHFSLRVSSREVPPDLSNVAAHVAQLMLDEFKPGFGIDLTLHKKMPVGSGLGSSAASSVASVVAVNALLPKPLKRIDLLRFALEGERLASGSIHADNAAPSLLGGAQLVRSYTPLDVVALPVRNTILWVVIHPHLVVRTEDARSVLPATVPMQSAIRQWGNVGGLVAGLARGDASLVGRSTEDVVAEPVRAKLVSGFHEVRDAALEAGAFGCTLSGSGPAMFAVASSLQSAKKIAAAMKKTFARVANAKADAFISRINMRGATIIRS